MIYLVINLVLNLDYGVGQSRVRRGRVQTTRSAATSGTCTSLEGISKRSTSGGSEPF